VDTCEIPIGSRGQYTAVVSAEDYAYLTQWRWTFKRSSWKYGQKVYARRCAWVRDESVEVGPRPGWRKMTILMHVEIITKRMGLAQPTDKHEVDHADVDSLNNARTNLRWATKGENNANQRSRITKAQAVAYAVAASSLPPP
jgi:hypothetical protein